MFKAFIVLVALAASCSPADFNTTDTPIREQTAGINQDPTDPTNPTGNPTAPIGSPINPFTGLPDANYVGDDVPGVTVTNGNNGATTYSLRCKIPPVVQSLTGPRSSGIQFKGEVCPVSTNELVVMLVNDESGSMLQADRNGFFTNFTGCGRYSAAKTLLDYIDSVSSDTDRIYVGMVGFATRANLKTTQGLVALDDFRNSFLRASNFCIAQTGNDAATNYQDAFRLAQQQLVTKTQLGLSQSAPEAVFIISDGMPTASNLVPFSDNHPVISNGLNQPQIDGINAARTLSPYAAVSALYLNNPTYAADSNVDPRYYLGQLTLDPARVAIATDAQQLASKMAELALPGLEVIPSSLRLTQSAGSNVYQFVSTPGDYTFAADPIRKNVYNFQTKYVQPMVNGSSTTDNIFKIELQARHPDGRIENISSQLTVRFTPTN